MFGILVYFWFRVSDWDRFEFQCCVSDWGLGLGWVWLSLHYGIEVEVGFVLWV